MTGKPMITTIGFSSLVAYDLCAFEMTTYRIRSFFTSATILRAVIAMVAARDFADFSPR